MSRDEQNERSEKRAKEIQDYIGNHPECKQKGQKHYAFVNNIKTELDVYELPRSLLVLNPNNWRFRAEFDKLKEERQKRGESLELDPENKDDEKTIRDLLRGTHEKVENKKRQDRYEDLKDDFINNAQNGSNGQTTPGAILYDGTYINGNRRDTVLDELSKKPPKGYNPTQFQNIRVVILPREVTLLDIKANETREQISLDSRERYDYTNSALMVYDYFQQLKDEKNCGDDDAIKEIANRVFGVGEDKIKEYLDFKKTADDFLITIKKPGQYSYIQDGDDEGGGIVVILQEIHSEIPSIKKRIQSQIKRSKITKSMFAFAWYARTKPKFADPSKKRLKPLNYNTRSFRIFKKEALATEESVDKLLESGTVDKINWENPDDHALAFETDIERANNITRTTSSILKPVVHLENAAASIARINREMDNPLYGTKIKNEILKNGLDHIKDIRRVIGEISKKLDKLKKSKP